MLCEDGWSEQGDGDGALPDVAVAILAHNGMRDIVAKVGEAPRLRIGIGKPDNMNLADYVLSNIDAMSKEIFDKAFMEAVDKITEFINRN